MLMMDNCSWFYVTDIMEGMGCSRHVASGLMSSLSDKGLIQDIEAGGPPVDYASWHITEAGAYAAADVGIWPAKDTRELED